MKEQHYIRGILDKGDYAEFPIGAVAALLADVLAVDEPVSSTIAELDLLIAAHRGEIKPFRYYAKRWSWSESKTRQFFINHGLMTKPESWKSNPSKRKKVQHSDNTRTTQVQHKNGSNSDEIAHVQHSDNTRTTQRQHSITYIDKERLPRAHVREEKPTIEDVILYAATLGYPESVAHSFFDHYESVEWVTGLDLPIKNWQAAFRKSGVRWREQQAVAQQNGVQTNNNNYDRNNQQLRSGNQTRGNRTGSRSTGVTDDDIVAATLRAAGIIANE
ncbi:MAG: hypothetical protein JNL32_03690 [Candidatus Kapabacteria bacterium]|nr:hypothetical protein [Candidatus Kapabacteria bacterium]